MTEQGKGVALAILGVVAIIAVVGLVLLFKGGPTGDSTFASYIKKSTLIAQTPERLCSNMACSSGMGAIYIGDEEHLDGTYYVCACSSQFTDQRISDWSNQWKGDPAQDNLEIGDYENVWRIKSTREY